MKRNFAACLCTVGVGFALCILAIAPVDASTSHAQDDDDPAVLRDYLSGNGLLNRGLYDLAADEYRKFLAAHPRHGKAALARYGLGVTLYRTGKNDEAAAEFATLFENAEFEFAAEVAFLLGQIRMAKGEYASAAPAFERVMRMQAQHELADDATALLLESLFRAESLDAMDEPFRTLTGTFAESPLRDRGDLFWGLAEMQRERFDEAAQHFEAMLQRNPQGEFAPRIELLLAKSLHQAEEFDRAAEQYRAVIEREEVEFLPDALYGLATILRHDGEAEEAAELLDRLLELETDSALIPQARFERARASFDLGDFARALGEFDSVKDEESLRDTAAYWLAKSEVRLGQFKPAADRLGQAIELFPESSLIAEMHYDRALALLQAGESAPAIEAFRLFRAGFPSHELADESLHTIVVALHQARQYAESAAEARRFVAEHPGHAVQTDVQFLIAENLYLAGDHAAAATEFESFLDAAPQHEQRDNATYRLGMALDRLGRHDEATARLATIARGADTPESFRPALFVLGDIAFDRGDWPAAEQHLRDYLAADENAANGDDALIMLALSQQRQDRGEESLAVLQRLLDNHSDSPHRAQAFFERGQTLISLGREVEAAEAFAQSLEENGGERFAPFALSHMGAIAVRAEDHETALEHYGRLVEVADDPALKAEAIFQQGQALMALERHDDAARKFAEVAAAQQDSPRIPLARANRALALSKLDDSQAALAAIDEALAAGPALDAPIRASLHYEKTWALRTLDQAEPAMASYLDLIRDHDDHVLGRYARLELGELLAEQGEAQSAADLLAPLLAARDSDPADLHERAAYRLGACLYELEEYEGAAEAFESCLAAHPETQFAPTARLLCGESLFRLDRHAAAREHLEAALQSSDDPAITGPALLRAGEALASLQEWDESEAMFARYLEEFEDSDLRYQAEFGRAFAVENQERHDDAIKAYTELIEHHQGPTAARAQFQIGECLFAQKMHQQAVREFLKVDILYAYPEWSAAALFEAGRCFEALAETGQAKSHFQQVKDRFADTRWAAMAEQRLAAIAAQAPPGRSR